MEYRIWMRNGDDKPEVVDRFYNEREAHQNATEYQHAYGPGIKIWVGKRTDEPGLDDCSSRFHNHNRKFHPGNYR